MIITTHCMQWQIVSPLAHGLYQIQANSLTSQSWITTECIVVLTWMPAVCNILTLIQNQKTVTDLFLFFCFNIDARSLHHINFNSRLQNSHWSFFLSFWLLEPEKKKKRISDLMFCKKGETEISHFVWTDKNWSWLSH